MKKRLSYITLLITALFVWWISDYAIIPLVQSASGYEQIGDKDLSVLLGHWVFGQLPRVLLCIFVWMIGSRLGIMPSFWRSLSYGVSWRIVIVTGLVATSILLVLSFGIGAAAGGTFGFHLYFPKMAGDLVSNLYEEIVYRGLMFSSFYGAAAAESFPLSGKLNGKGLLAGTLGSSIIFAIAHEQYSVPLRVAVGMMSVVLVYPWVASRSLWAPWIAHTLGDVIVDSILKL